MRESGSKSYEKPSCTVPTHDNSDKHRDIEVIFYGSIMTLHSQ